MPVASLQGVPVLRVTHLHLTQQFGQRLDLRGNHDQMNVIGHEAIAQNLNRVMFGILLQQAEIYLPVNVGEKYVATLVAALSNVMGTMGDDDSTKSRHGWLVWASPRTSLKI